ncbi:hypothetical protein DPMN_095895 [Dreissena polymorpha]|uniref:Uncharacterized protein n=1 Tax=Dreissena polymorpha TaxID=45954 RepID=A0A9D4L7R4_DREPO|nr:hypothetical protein DPMN_095895 [Dreissena polymorpha]
MNLCNEYSSDVFGDHLVMSILASTMVPWLVSPDILVFRCLYFKDGQNKAFSQHQVD